MAKAAAIAVVIVVVVAGILGLYALLVQPDQSSSQQRTREFDLRVVDRTLDLDPPVLSVSQGDLVVITVDADEEGEFHVHTYDEEVLIEPTETSILRFNATLAGRFDLEWHLEEGPEHDEEEEIVIGALEVNP
ncbi:MAG: hypothetical protein ACE5KH_05890 [Candidatus Geothermarchaeales archaeon]